MLAWLLWRLKRVERIHEAAGLLISEFGIKAGAERTDANARVDSVEAARDWKRVACGFSPVRTPKRAALDTATVAWRLTTECDPAAEPECLRSTESILRIQFLCATPIRAKAI